MSVGESVRDAWPSAVFDAPLLRGLDARARREIELAGRLVSPAEGGVIYRAGEGGETFFVVASGEVRLRGVRRGDEGESDLRAATPGESFGEESTVGLGRRATAVAGARTTVAEIPVALFQRAAQRSGKAEIAERIERAMKRAATGDLLRMLALTRDLPAREIDLLLDAVTYVRAERGQTIYREGDRASDVFLVADGMVQIQVDDGERLHVRAYVGRGDFFGEEEVAHAIPRRTSAVASGASLLLAIPSRAFREIDARHPELVAGLRRVAEAQAEGQRAIVGRAAANATQHLFRDLYRLDVARSLLVIDLETCVRCGHCAWACEELYGAARLVRRGDKVVARVDDTLRSADASGSALAPQSLLLPNSCQHCENPACMVDCPTGAIGRDPNGEVFVRDALCTGCAACAKACPWDNIQMAMRPADAPRPSGGAFPEVAVKCDLCRGYESGPACVQVCPTSSIFRINPSEDIADVRALFDVHRGAAFGPENARARAPEGRAAARALEGRPLVVFGALVASSAIALVGLVMQGRGLFHPERGIGLAAGILAAIGVVALLAYALPKRGVRFWMKKKDPRAPDDARAPRAPVRSRVAGHVGAHVAIGLVTTALAVAHGPLSSPRPGAGFALLVALLASGAAGALTAIAYRTIPARLARLERTAALPEDFAPARRELLDRLGREVSGKSELVKRLFEKVLLPYAKSFVGPVLLVASGRSLRDEERSLRARIDGMLEGRGSERLAGLTELVRLVVELRSLPAQRALLALLRAWLPLHVVTFFVAIALLALHVIVAIGRVGG